MAPGRCPLIWGQGLDQHEPFLPTGPGLQFGNGESGVGLSANWGALSKLGHTIARRAFADT
jgi:hypothetical protein